jgi:hypothetical protein
MSTNKFVENKIMCIDLVTDFNDSNDLFFARLIKLGTLLISGINEIIKISGL